MANSPTGDPGPLVDTADPGPVVNAASLNLGGRAAVLTSGKPCTPAVEWRRAGLPAYARPVS